MAKKYVHWKDGEMWVGYLEEYLDYLALGITINESEEILRDIYKELDSSIIFCVRRIAQFLIS